MKAGSPQREELSDRKVLTERSSGVVVAHEEDMLATLEIPRKVINLCLGSLSLMKKTCLEV